MDNLESLVCIVNKNIFGSNNIVLHNLCHHVVFSPLDVPANITLQPIPGLMPLTEVYLNPGLFCLVLHTTLWFVREMNSQQIITASYPTLALAFDTYILLTSSPSPMVPFFPISHMSQLTTHATYIPSIYGIPMPSQHLKSTRIHSYTIFKFIPRHQYDRETSAFR